jgi:tRNA A-37 threonylcarbamoyl transferase component Bud32
LSEPTSAPSDADLFHRLSHALAPSYELDRELGRGGMAIVYSARDTRLKRRVAVKLLPPELAFRADIRSRFLREAETAAQLNHPNIVPIYSVDERDGLVYFVMALVHGGSLGDRLRQQRALPIDDVRRVLRELADGLGYAHRNGVVHRDIKPDNILIDADTGRAMITDFGIARATTGDEGTRLTATGAALGTPTYMSPEQCSGERDIDGRSDLYSLGAMTYQMLTGEAPFIGGSTPAVMMKHVTEAPVPPRTRRAEIPRDLEQIVLKLLAKDPAHRFATGEDVIAALDGAPVTLVAPPPEATVPAIDGRQLADQIRARVIAEAQTRIETKLATRQARRDARQKRDREHTPAERLRSFRRQLASYAGTSLFLLGINYMTGTGFWWAIFPILGMGLGTAGTLGRLWADGIPLRSVFTGALPAGTPTSALGAGDDAVAGPHGEGLKQARADYARIQDSIGRLSETERKMLPDVKPTADALFARVQALAPALDRLDAEIGTDRAKALDERIAQIEAQSGDAADRERRLNLLRRQRDMLAELETSRAKLLEQYESACLVLQNLSLDLLKVRSSGLDSALSGLTSATQEARALSREIGYVLNAADELREIDAGGR